MLTPIRRKKFSLPPINPKRLGLCGYVAATIGIFSFTFSSPLWAQYVPPSGSGGGSSSGGGGYANSPHWELVVSKSGNAAWNNSSYPSPNNTGTTPWSQGTNPENSINGQPISAGTTADVSTSGSETFTFTWVGGTNHLPAPKNVVIREEGDVTWASPVSGGSGEGVITVDGTENLAEFISTDDGHSGHLKRVSYQVKDSSSGIVFVSIGCKSSAQGAGVSGVPSSQGAVGCHHTCTIGFSYIDLTLQGTTLDSSGKDNILIGQGCQASLGFGSGALQNGSPVAGVSNASLDPTTYNWTVSGDYFDNYAVNTTDASTGKVISCADYDAVLVDGVPRGDRFKKPDPRRWIWKVPSAAGTVEVSAKVVLPTLMAPIGTITEKKTVIVQEPDGIVLSATSIPDPKVRITKGDFYILLSQNDPHDVAHQGYHLGIGDWTNSVSGQVPPVVAGIEFTGKAETPALFGSGTGTWQFVQLTSTNYYSLSFIFLNRLS